MPRQSARGTDTGPAHPKPPQKPCHNCRRKRLRCDRSFPGCEKCHAKGDKCLGYGALLRWTDARTTETGPRKSVSPPKQASASPPLSASPTSTTSSTETSAAALSVPLADGGNVMDLASMQSVCTSLIQPLLQDIEPVHRLYISHFDKALCPDLVSYDQAGAGNPFRIMLTLVHDYAYLREIILATSAVHRFALCRFFGAPSQQHLVDALAAKGRAYRFLSQALDHLTPETRPMAMIAVVFFINFELIDSGRGKWKPHIKAAANLLTSLQSLGNSLPSEIAQLADMVIADYIAYNVYASGFANPEENAVSTMQSIDIVASLEKVAAHTYGCCPPVVLNILSKATKLFAADTKAAVHLCEELIAFDVSAWVHNIKGLGAVDDRGIRIHMANIHRLAVCLYIFLVVPDTSARMKLTVDALHAELLACIGNVPFNHLLAKGLVWPTFMASAQTDDVEVRKWSLRRMNAIRFASPLICPWGYVVAAADMLQGIWETRDARRATGQQESINWLQEIRGMADPCLIV
ncbi:fungal-specific transcription factor domain-domain-containing protein [Coniella lustricola]|uniref:Fungal-specific transcription factor domain-domain-containing protein n=1 Tax=Coniella lustricola TaxID=2025994 RepID=A0A2T3ANX8_9PEZI|nr:fungal-specific transcription factor domain-domain-containing protein [Coniella lustricola]